MQDDQSNIIQLQDEDGNDVNFEHLMTIEHNGAYYILLQATEDMEDCMEGEAIILKIDKDEKGEDVYVTVEDEEEYETVYNKCVAELEKEEEEPEDDD